MSNQFETEVMQDAYPAYQENSGGRIRLNPRGEVVTPDYFTQLALDGRVFNASNAVLEVTEDISKVSLGASNISPALLLDVPSGTTAVPLEIMVDIASPGTDEDVIFLIATDDGTRYSSGGVAITPINMRKDDPQTSGCSFYSGSTAIVASANTDDDVIFTSKLELEATPKTTQTGIPTWEWSARRYVPPVLVGPAALLVYIASAAADKTYQWSVKWAEIPTTNVT